MLNAHTYCVGLVNAEDHQWSDSYTWHGKNMLGVRSKKSVWFWFKFYTDGTLIFDHAYSQINGSTDRGMAARQRAENLLIKLAKY